MALVSKNVFLLKNNNQVLGYTGSRPITVMAFKHRNHAETIKKVITNRQFRVQRDAATYILQSFTLQSNKDNCNLTIDETPESYMMFLTNVNSLYYTLVSDIIIAKPQIDTRTVKLITEYPGPSPKIDEELIKGNLKKLFFHS